jgi:DNA-binding HxlR family transcriptional regulator
MNGRRRDQSTAGSENSDGLRTAQSSVETAESAHRQTLSSETGLRVVQQILAHESSVLSVEELSYRNPETESGTIDYHLRELAKADIVERRSAVNCPNDLPNTYWAVTPRGVALLDDLGFYDEVEVLATADDALARTDRIERIESFAGRPTAETDP